MVQRAPAGRGLSLGIIEPHLARVGGIRRMVEFANRLVARGHDVTFYLPDGADLACRWMRCDARIAPISDGAAAPLDVVVFNHEPQWYLLDRFPLARRRVFYALHYGTSYAKEGTFDALRVPVDLQLANSNWTADQIEADIGVRPVVQLGGVNREMFQPYGGAKRYTVLCTGLSKRWKGTDTIRDACQQLGVKLDGYGDLDLSQPDLGRAYDAALVFAVGSWFEGFCQPGLEALACGTPLVTTDNGGSREYAIDGHTALVVPPRDVEAMADAIDRLLDDEGLAKQLAINGLDLVEEKFDWEQRTDEFLERLDGVVAGTASAPPPPRPAAPSDPELSVVTLAWDNLEYTQKFCESVRRHTDTSYELIVVDNGSAPDAAEYASVVADTCVLNPTNLGFSTGMNQGLERAQGTWVAFCNNDTILPDAWAALLLETAAAHPDAGLIVPALTAARNPYTVRTAPGTEIEVLAPFSAPPAAVVYLARADLVRALGGWSTDYEIASGEDVDLCFAVWVNDLDIVYDQRVLVDHIGKGSASRLDDWEGLWAENRRRFLDKWQNRTGIPRLPGVDPDRFERNLATAGAVAEWMQRYFTTRDRTSAGAPEPETWSPAPVAPTDGRPYLGRLGDGTVLVVDDGHARPVGSDLLVGALACVFGRPVAIGSAAGDALADGAPVEVVVGPSGVPYVVVGGNRLPVRGLPLPSPITSEEIDMLPDGPELDVTASTARASRDAADPRTRPINGKASEWMQTLQKNPTTQTPYLVRKPNGKVFLIEGNQRRHVKSGLLAAALERELGTPKLATTDELRTLDASPPVEVFEAPNAAPFVVVGGKRLPVRGLPPLNPVSTDDLGRFPKGKPLNVANANVSRSKYEAAISGRYQVQRLRSAISRRGVIGVTTIGAKRALRTARRRLG